MSKARLFFFSLLVTTVALTTIIYLKRPKHAAPRPIRIADGVFITSQLAPEDVFRFPVRGFKTIVDIRPDGEAKDQAPASAIENVSENLGMIFHYVPVPHENIPDGAVAAVSETLSHDPKPVLLYCRTGRRAVRTLALAQASQADGPSTDAILEMVKTAGFSAEDLKPNIVERVSHRTNPQTASNQ